MTTSRTIPKATGGRSSIACRERSSASAPRSKRPHSTSATRLSRSGCRCSGSHTTHGTTCWMSPLRGLNHLIRHPQQVLIEEGDERHRDHCGHLRGRVATGGEAEGTADAADRRLNDAGRRPYARTLRSIHRYSQMTRPVNASCADNPRDGGFLLAGAPVGASLEKATMRPALRTPNRLSPTIRPDATSVPSRSARAGILDVLRGLLVPRRDDGADDDRERRGHRQVDADAHRERRDAQLLHRAERGVERDEAGADERGRCRSSSSRGCRRSRPARARR